MNSGNDPFWETLQSICDRKKVSGFRSLSRTEQTFYAMNHLKGAVNRGGFHPYFDMAPREEIEIAIKGFRENGRPDIARLTERAAEVLFPGGLPIDFIEQLAQLPCGTDEEIENDIDPEWSLQIEKLNQEFYSIRESTYRVVEDYYTSHWGAPSSDS